ncbi:helix-hairpin-helix domain-containing protein [Clostridium sp. OS1-26]|uniref:ComEA family DNA-binding protein n=1 Tax=Clostridium sp. OS1-26 TaxID=3070681 RepID=UPI0027E0755E|nr:helix-hairpin-helix domain-containing protein [Clostridium sp. OS1-26]WML33265.1 helix-hairpin-helix domain-containing protein [Clostridium sp. OS1-26]
MKVGMIMNITSRGKKWEILNSLWILFTFTLAFFNWIGFFYIGYKTKCKKWIFSGLIYSIPFILAIAAGINNSFTAGLTIILGIIGIVHAFMIRTEYLIRLDAIKRGKVLSDSEVKKIITTIKLSKMNLEDIGYPQSVSGNGVVEPNFSVEKSAKIEVKESPIESEESDKEDYKNKFIDINIASESELASLPGIGSILAKKAINHRETKGYFNSVDELAEVLSLKPHVLERIKPLITVKCLEHEHKNSNISNKNGRIVDF